MGLSMSPSNENLPGISESRPGIMQRFSNWMTPERAAGFQALGMGLSQLGAGQPVNLSPAHEALQQRQMRSRQQQMLEESGIMQRLTPDQRSYLAQIEPGAAMAILGQVMFPPAPSQPASVQEYLFATRRGYTGSFEEWRASGGGSNEETYGLTPMWGQDEQGNPVAMQLGNRGGLRPVELPPGVRPSMGQTQRVDVGDAWLILDRDGNVIRREDKTFVGTPGSGEVITPGGSETTLTTQAIPGGAQDREQQAAQDAAQASAGQAEIAGGTILSAAVRARDANNERMIGGLGGRIIAGVDRGSPNAEIERQIEAIRANGRFESLKALRAASPSGSSGLGSLTEPEGRALEAAAGALDVSSPNFERDLEDYTRRLMRTIHGPEEGDRIFNETWNAPAGGPAAGPQYDSFESFAADAKVQAAARDAGVSVDAMWEIYEEKRARLERQE